MSFISIGQQIIMACQEEETYQDKKYFLQEMTDIISDCYKELETEYCEDCGKPWNSEYHKSDECVNINEDELTSTQEDIIIRGNKVE